MLRNKVGGEIRAIAREDFFKLMDESLHERMNEMLARPDVDGMMAYQIPDMWSSQFGRISAVIFGPGCSIKTAFDAAAGHLGETPSQFAYPTFVYVKGSEAIAA